jgi:hypothetical protein
MRLRERKRIRKGEIAAVREEKKKNEELKTERRK